MTNLDLRIAALHEAIEIAKQVALERGVPAGTRHGQVSYGAQAVERALKDKIADAMLEASA